MASCRRGAPIADGRMDRARAAGRGPSPGKALQATRGALRAALGAAGRAAHLGRVTHLLEERRIPNIRQHTEGAIRLEHDGTDLAQATDAMLTHCRVQLLLADALAPHGVVQIAALEIQKCRLRLEQVAQLR